MRKFLIIRFSSIGDIVLTSPIARCIKEQIPDSVVHYLTKIEYEDIVSNSPYIDKVFPVEKKELHQAIRELQKEKYELIIDLHHNLRSMRVKKKLKARSASFPKLNYEKFLLTKFKINKLPKGLHIVDRYFETVKSIGVENDGAGLDYFIPQKDAIDVSKFDIKSNYVAFSIAAKFPTKKMPNDMIIELIRKIDHQVVLLGGLADVDNANEITANCRDVIDLTGHLYLNKTASVLKQASKVVTFDTGLMHIAAAFQKPIISIWGNTVTDFGMYPYMPGNEELYSIHEVDLNCRPCSKIGYEKCPKKHFNCMRQQNLDTIAQAINS